MSDFRDIPLSQYSYRGGFSEPIGKDARYMLTLICLKGMEREYRDTPLSQKSRGRPPSPYLLLARILGVSVKSVRRWADSEAVHSNDFNAGRLAKTAFRYDPEKTAQVLREDVERYRRNIEEWIEQANGNIGTHPYPDIPIETEAPRQVAEEASLS